jgi:flagellar biosynthetic protein FliO
VEDISVVALLGRLAVSMAVVLGLMALAARLVRRRGLGGTRGAGPVSRIEVLARHGLGRTSSVQLVRVGGRTLVLGVTDAHVSVLSEADPLLVEAELALAPVEAPSPSAPGWGPLVELLKDATARGR